MNNIELKNAINEDIEAIKHLDIEIIPARSYYLGNLKLVLGGIWKIGIIIFFSILYVSIFNPGQGQSDPLSNFGVGKPLINLVTETLLVSFFISLASMVVLFQAFNHYFLIKYHLLHKLKTGSFIIKKLKQAAYLFWVLFALCCLLFASYADTAAIYLMIVLAFVISGVLTFFTISMELNRVGVSTLFRVVSTFFNKDKVTKSI